MLLYPFPAQSRPVPPRPTGIAERKADHRGCQGLMRPYAGRAKRCPPPQRTRLRPAHLPRRASEATLVSDKGPLHADPLPQPTRKTQSAPVTPERFRSNSAKPNCEDQRRGNRGARWEQNGLLTRGAAAACAARYLRVGAAGAQSGRGIRDEDGPPPPRVREPRAYQDDRARSCPSRPPR